MTIFRFSQNFLILLIVATAFGAANNAYSAEGGITSGGGEEISDQYNPWFVDKDFATFCLQVSKDFSEPEENARMEVFAAVADWEKTLAKFTFRPLGAINGKLRNYTKKLVFQAKCARDTDLIIMLGGALPSGSSSDGPFVGVARRTQYDPALFSGKGFIWLTPDTGPKAYKSTKLPFWNKGLLTYSILLHELGHVFGFSHEFGDFMAYDMPSALIDLARRKNYFFDPKTLETISEKPSSNFLAELQVFNAYGFQESLGKVCFKYWSERNPVLVEELMGLQHAQIRSLCFEKQRDKILVSALDSNDVSSVPIIFRGDWALGESDNAVYVYGNYIFPNIPHSGLHRNDFLVYDRGLVHGKIQDISGRSIPFVYAFGLSNRLNIIVPKDNDFQEISIYLNGFWQMLSHATHGQLPASH